MERITTASLSALPTLLRSFERHLRAENKSPRTIATYLTSGRQLSDFLEEHGMPTDATALRREHVETFITHLIETRSPATANNRYRGLQQLFNFLLEEGEIERSPMEGMSPPHVPEQPVPVLSDDDLRELLKACAGSGFEERRDTAILRFFIDSGIRRGELAGLTLDDLDLDTHQVAYVMGKGGRGRACPFGSKTARALDCYVRVRAKHPGAGEKWLWLSRRENVDGSYRLTSSGVRLLVMRRAREAGIRNVHPHMLRHVFAPRWLADGGNDSDLMRLAGWRSREMVSRYAASAADERARDAHQSRGLGNRL